MKIFPKYETIIPKLTNDKVKNYSLLLKTREWQLFRERILFRDGSKCVKCGLVDDQDIYEEIVYEKSYSEICREIHDFNQEVDRYYKDNPDEILSSLLGIGKPFIGKKATPAQHRFIRTIHLEIHHKFYVKNRLPWEYSPNVLESLCGECHEKEHAANANCFTTMIV